MADLLAVVHGPDVLEEVAVSRVRLVADVTLVFPEFEVDLEAMIFVFKKANNIFNIKSSSTSASSA